MKGVAYLAGGLAAAAVAATCLVAPGYYAYLLGTVATTALLGIGLNVLFGLAGEVSLGQAGFLALGAYGVAILETRIGLDFWAALAISVVSVSIIATLLSVPALRLTGPYLAMVTIAFGFIVESVSIEWAGLTGGSSGIASIPAPFGTGGMALLSCLICALALAGFAWLRRNTLGLAMRAVATAPLAARGIGIAPLQVRTIAFVLAAAAAALAGGLQAALTGFIAPSSFPFSQSILFLLVVVVGGAGRSFGPLAGAVAVSLLPEVLSGLAEYRLLVFGFALLVVLWVAPDGIAGLADKLRSRTSTPRGDVGPEAAFGHLAAAGGVLQVRGVKVAFGGVVAVSGVDFGALAGRITSVIGPNGAGKTTLLNLLSGFQRPDGGRVEIDGLDITGLPAQAVARAGMARTFQTAQPFVGLSVLDNVRLGLMRGRLFGSASSPLARSLLTFVGYTGRDDIASDALPHVDRRLLEIARALATRPAVLLLDEPAAGLDAADTSRLDGVLRAIAAAGIAVVLVEHDMSLVMAVSDEIIVLDAGRRIAAGTPDVVRADPAVRAAYLGDLAPAEPGAPRRTGAVVLDAANLSAGYGRLPVLDHVAVAIGAGETIALLGPNGAGKSTLMKALSGLIRPVSGAIMLKGADLARLPAHRVARAGVVLVPEGRQVFSHLSVVKNMRLGTTRRSGFEASEIEAMLERFPRLRAKLDIPAGLLSGGEQQMLALARGMLAHPEVMLLDEPSLGLAPAIAFELFQQLARLRDEGMTLLVVDQMAGQALAISDRYYVLSGGRVMSSGNARDLDESQLAESYFGPSTEKQAT